MRSRVPATQTTEEPTAQEALEAFWRTAERRSRVRRHTENRAAWYAHHIGPSEAFRKLSEEHEARARELLEGRGHGV